MLTLMQGQFYNFFVIAFCAVSQPLNRKITKMVLRLHLKSYCENYAFC